MSSSQIVTLRLTPYQARKLKPLFETFVREHAADATGILAGQFYHVGSYVHGYGRTNHAMFRVGFLPHKYAKIVAERALGETVPQNLEGKA